METIPSAALAILAQGVVNTGDYAENKFKACHEQVRGGGDERGYKGSYEVECSRYEIRCGLCKPGHEFGDKVHSGGEQLGTVLNEPVDEFFNQRYPGLPQLGGDSITRRVAP